MTMTPGIFGFLGHLGNTMSGGPVCETTDEGRCPVSLPSSLSLCFPAPVTPNWLNYSRNPSGNYNSYSIVMVYVKHVFMVECLSLIWMPAVGIHRADEKGGTQIFVGWKASWHVLSKLCYSRTELDSYLFCK